ncbi:glycosyltransferase family 2 protein [Phycisphaerales bacterium AB-hyl4]|uniref:Glycosyltransferase family 2 protein n=1 Tax=Natronomicrosphaera hydrolytica TaxID=3242702 RepID=A0ABV4U8E2_9BACT
MRTLVAIPVYNEEKYVTQVLREVRKYAEHILVVDDGSTDQTPMLLAQQKVDVIRHAENRGYGRSIRDAFRYAQCYCYDWLITMDCDEQHEPRSLPDFDKAIEADDADVLSGSRYLDPAYSGDPPPPDRRAINLEVSKWVNEHLDLHITDSFCGYKAYRVSKLKHLNLNEDGYAIPLQFWVQAAAHQLRVKEVPIRLIYNDPNRSFGGKLDDPEHRIAHYREVFDAELEKYADKLAAKSPCSCPGR